LILEKTTKRKMMNKILLILFFVVSILSAQEKNKMIIDDKSGKPILIGICDREAFSDSNFAWWFNSEYKLYSPEEIIIDSIKNHNNEFAITIVMGTWCSDSRREVPNFYKLLDLLKFPEDKITLINIDRKKDGINTDISKLNIELVPTFIIYINGNEIGRIIETPIESLEKDLLKILENNLNK